MGNPLRYLTYFVFSALSLTCLIYYMVHLNSWNLYGYSLGYMILIGSLIYTIYMFFYTLLKPEPVPLQEHADAEMIVPKNFMADTYHKFLFCLAFADFIFYLIYIFRINFAVYDYYPNRGFLLVDIYTNIVLPIYLMCDIFITPRNRHLHYVKDILILFLLCAVHFFYRFFINAYVVDAKNLFFPLLSDYLIFFLLSLNGYGLYDYLLHRKLHSQREYAIFNQPAV